MVSMSKDRLPKSRSKAWAILEARGKETKGWDRFCSTRWIGQCDCRQWRLCGYMARWGRGIRLCQHQWLLHLAGEPCGELVFEINLSCLMAKPI